MSTTERILQLHVSLLVALGAIMLGIGQADATLPVLVVVSAVASLCFTDWLRWFSLNRNLANLAALLALLFSFSGYFAGGSEQNQLMAIAHLLVYLQVVLFFQRKNNRIYWILIVLSLLQVVVAAAMNVGLEFGFLLLVYMAAAFSTLAFFFAHRESIRLTDEAGVGSNGPAGEATRSSGPTGAASDEASPGPGRPEPLWRRVTGDRDEARSHFDRQTVEHQLRSRQCLWHVVVMGMLTLAFTVVLFYSVPRRNIARRARAHGQGSIVGFSRELTLNEMGQILQSPTPVMRVSFSRRGEPYEVRGDQYYRGTVLARYISNMDRSADSAGWHGLLRPHRDELYPYRSRQWQSWSLKSADESPELIRQEFVLEPMHETLLFSAYPAYRVAKTPDDVRYFALSGELRRKRSPDRVRPTQYRYVLGTEGYRNGFQAWIVPHETDVMTPDRWNLHRYELYRLAFYPPIFRDWFPRLTTIADEIVQTEKANGSDKVQIARALQNHFRTGQYRYTLDLSEAVAGGDDQIDPVEDFVANRRAGHCEYFASALTLMLRSQGMPARLVLGYKGGEYNSVGGYYQIRALHAHAWVEAHLTQEEALEYARPGQEVGEAGAWLRLDPTPASEYAPTFRAEGGILAKVEEALDYAQLLWHEYVLDLNPADHEQLAARTSSALTEFLENPSWKDLVALVGPEEREDEAAMSDWINWRSVCAGLLLGAIGLGGARAAFSCLVFLSRLIPDRRRRLATRGSPVEFYRRFERLMARRGYVRSPGQTQREFADSLARRWGSDDADTPGENSARAIVRAFYRVRFGGASLDNGEVERIEHALMLLETAVPRAATVKASQDPS